MNSKLSDDVPTAEKFTDSPWFWGYIFATAALIALALAAPKYSARQSQLERQFLARQEGGQTIKGADGQTISPPSEKNLILSLVPLFLICGILLVVAWSRFWLTRTAPESEEENG
jgi:hypothetical protein